MKDSIRQTNFKDAWQNKWYAFRNIFPRTFIPMEYLKGYKDKRVRFPGGRQREGGAEGQKHNLLILT